MPILPRHIERFLEDHIASVDQLELLVLLFNSPQTAWTAAAAGQIVHCPTQKAETYLQALAGQGFLAAGDAPGGSYRYDPRDSARDQAVRDMVDFYRERPVSVIRRVYEPRVDKVQAFADAFKLGKKET